MPLIAPVAFPIVEMVFPAALRAALATRTEPYAQGVVVGKKVPATRPPRLITFRRDGGPSSEWTDHPRLGINVWAATDADVDNLARLVVALLPTLVGPQVDSVRVLSGPSDVTDASAQPQRYITAEAATRAANL
jgi:hypothetical protein